MNVYLAARYSRRAEMLDVAAELARHGHQVTSRWLNGSHELGDVAGDDERARLAREDMADLYAAQVMLAFSEPVRASTNSRGGRHVEFGLALASLRRVIVVGNRENVFHYLPAVTLVPDLPAALALLDEWKAQPQTRGAQ